MRFTQAFLSVSQRPIEGIQRALQRGIPRAARRAVPKNTQRAILRGYTEGYTERVYRGGISSMRYQLKPKGSVDAILFRASKPGVNGLDT